MQTSVLLPTCLLSDYTTDLLLACPLPDYILLVCFQQVHYQTVYHCSATHMPITSLYTTVLLPTCPISDCVLLLCNQNSHYRTVYYWSATNRPITMKGERKRGRQKKRWEDNIKKWTGMGFGASLRAAEDREGWKGIVAMSSVVPRRPPRLRD